MYVLNKASATKKMTAKELKDFIFEKKKLPKKTVIIS